MSWNRFSRNIARKLINDFTPQHTNNNAQESPSLENLPKILTRLPSIGKYGNTLAKRFINKTRRLLKGACKFILHVGPPFPVRAAKVHILAKKIVAFLRALKNIALVIVQKLMPTLTLASTNGISKF